MVDLTKQHPGDNGGIDNYSRCAFCDREVRVWVGVPGTLGGVEATDGHRCRPPHTHHTPTTVPPWQRRNGVTVRTQRKDRWYDSCDPTGGCTGPSSDGSAGGGGCDGPGCDGCDPGGGCLVLDVLLAWQLIVGLLAPRRSLARHGERLPAPGLRGRALAAIRLYQLRVSSRRPARCRFRPTCSAYGAGAVSRHGLLRGTVLTARRVRRCRPGAEGGPDPVP